MVVGVIYMDGGDGGDECGWEGVRAALPRASPARFAPLTRAPLRWSEGGLWMDVPSAEAPACAGMTGG